MPHPISVGKTWIENFCAQPGNELFCEVDEDFILDRFNLTGLSTAPERLPDILELITGWPNEQGLDEEELEENLQESIARHFYGLVHARYILTARGLHKMMSKYVHGHFGRCPRALCRGQPVVPIGLQDQPSMCFVKLYCPRCEDVYHPSSVWQSTLDGAYFGTSFPGMLFQAYQKHIPNKFPEQFTLKIFGFKIHENAELVRWQQNRRIETEKMAKSLK